MDSYQQLRENCVLAFSSIFNQEISVDQVQIEQTSSDFTGDLTIVVFPLLKYSRKSPPETGQLLGEFLKKEMQEINSFEVVKGFLNIMLSDSYWVNFLQEFAVTELLQTNKNRDTKKYLVEYSSPNTNKPLHLGHIRNNLIGHAVAEILKVRGHQVIKANLINDRGIHICKSMVAWLKEGKGITPELAGKKGDHLVGDFYVAFDKLYKHEIDTLISNGLSREEAEKNAPVILEAQELLQKWEQDDLQTREVWQMMNEWVYAGFDTTYERMGISFDKVYHESETYLLGKELIKEGLERGVFYQKEDQSVWVDLTDDGLDEKLLLRPDGTSVYITQDLGTAQLKQDDFHPDKSVYIVGNEQEYHFQVLAIILKKLQKNYADSIYHLSYGMVDLPEGKMKSREGKVVDADDLMDEMFQTALEYLNESGKANEIPENERDGLCEMIGQAALKFYILKTDIRKRMVFNPKESIDFQGTTGPFVQYSYARIRSLMRKSEVDDVRLLQFSSDLILSEPERDILKKLYYFNDAIAEAEMNLDPSKIAHYIYHLAKSYNRFYHDYPILKEQDLSVRYFRLRLSLAVSEIISLFMNLLGIQVPEKM
ncbi:arginine--tRNA ligase [Bacteroidota bacterium]